MKKFVPAFTLAVLFLLISMMAHGVYLLEWTRNGFMVGINDGLSQMMPFKSLLYDQYTEGEFFYAPNFGLGRDTFSGLAYYFSTSIVFLLTVGFVFLLEVIGIVNNPDILFWAHAAVWISITRLAAVLAIAYAVFRYMDLPRLSAFLGAAVYGLSGIYFRHVVFWEFFADACLWLPLLVLGVEKLFREHRAGWLVFAVAISMFDNFYFAYVNFLLISIYFLFRLFMPLTVNETKKSKVLLKAAWAAFIGAGISAVSFIPAVHAFVNNHRPPYRQEIEWFNVIDNVLYTSSFIVFPAIFVLLVFTWPLYRDRKFRFFAILTAFGLLLHFSPLAASVFNGFSAPQYRWEYFLSFAAGGAVAAGFNRLSDLKLKPVVFAGGASLFIYAFYALTDKNLEVGLPLIAVIFIVTSSLFSVYAAALSKRSKTGQAVVISFVVIVFLLTAFRFAQDVADRNIDAQLILFLAVIGVALLTFLLVTRAVKTPSTTWQAAFFIIFGLIGFVNGFQLVVLVMSGSTHEVTEEFITGPDYDDPEIRGLLEQIEERETEDIYRVDWMEGIRNNTALVQDFRGVNAYASILNKHVLHFYLYHLEIDMERESVSRYATLGKRANLHSLLQADYIILLHEDENKPFGFVETLSSEHYTVYENRHPLPFVRVVSETFSEKSLEEAPVLRREHAMLSGVILQDIQNPSPLPPPPTELPFTIRGVDAHYDNGFLEVTGETGGVDLELLEKADPGSDLYVSFHLTNHAPSDGFPLSVNSYSTTRKPNDSVYKTFVDDLTIRVPADDTVRIRMDEGRYELTDIAVYEEPYEVLREKAASEAAVSLAEWDGSHIRAEVTNETGGHFFVLPVPYEKGWQAKVNGENAEVMQANYSFLAVPAAEGFNRIELTFRPPYFRLSLMITFLSLALAVVYVRFQKRT
ncbi:YfhO family protein [Planococcus salinus]|uniref:YfhO family protein n=1 Tax=Planococcus salinus TaxID=1848460 RepID=A0A3M8PCF0_9BACL|nr:YfhO family protein [Planococcus salinus]RNF40834.1 hypothetical protein EEX84_00310 [Planococcus salinus]